jgi:LacI family transcriptional regulator
MMKNVTIKTIADALNLSRNTVSKVINGQKVPLRTKNLVISKATELGYKGFNINPTLPRNILNILFLSGKPLYSIEFFMSVITALENSVLKFNSKILQYVIPKEYYKHQLYKEISTNKVSAIVVVELFDKTILRDLLVLNIPIVFLDSINGLFLEAGRYDCISLGSHTTIKSLIDRYVKRDKTNIGFVGDYKHCLGFNQRFRSVIDSLMENNIDIKKNLFILEPDSSLCYSDSIFLSKMISNMKIKPDALFCANDYIAVKVVEALKLLNYKIPEDVEVIGFDNSKSSREKHPYITTIGCDNGTLAAEMVEALISRLNNPTKKKRLIIIETNIIHRETTTLFG